MSLISFFHKATVAPSATGIGEADHQDWRIQPVTGRQCKWIAVAFRSSDLTAAPKAWLDGTAVDGIKPLSELAVYDEAAKLWPEVGKLTKGQASDLYGMLKKLPKTGNGPVVTAQAEPIVAPKAAPKRKGDTITVDGVTYRIAGVAR